MLERPLPSNPVVALVDEVIRINGRIRSIFKGVKTATGFSSMEITVLTAVVESRLAPTVPQIGRSLGHSRQVIQRAVNALTAAKLVETAPNPNHKRAPLLRATLRGQTLKRETDAHATKAIRTLLRGIDAVKCRRVAGELRELRGEMETYLRSARAG